MLQLGLILLVTLTAQDQARVGAAPEPAHEEPESPGDATPAVPESRAKRSRGARPSTRVQRSRTGAKVTGHVVPEGKLRAAMPPRPSGNLHIHSLANHESLKVNIYNEDGSYNTEALQSVSHLLRCKRTDTEREIEPRLLAILSHVHDHFGEARIEIVSGYRNQRRTSSYHYKGSASDIRIVGVKPAKLRAYLESLDAGGMGIGLYPRTGFIHVDVRPPPSYRWIDWSRSDPDAPDKRPPRGFKRKKLQS